MKKKICEALTLIGSGIIIGAIFWYDASFQEKPIPNANYKILEEINYPERVENQNPETSRMDIKSFIKNQFDLYRKKGIDLANIEALSSLPDDQKRKIGICRVQIVDGKIYADTKYQSYHEYCSIFIDGLSRVLEKNPIGNIDFIVCSEDQIATIDDATDELLKNSPILLFSKDTASNLEKDKILIPDLFLIMNNKWPKISKKISLASKHYKWDQKIEKIYWRGSTTGGDYNIENYSKLPRISLVMLSKSFPNIIDAKFTKFAQFSNDDSGKELLKIVKTLDLTDGYTREEDHLAYKYLISVDGNTCAWLRVPWIMLSNSVLLKQESSKIELFYAGMKPYIHYVPVSNDLSDVFEKLRWLQTHDKEAQQISENASNFVKANLLQEDIDEYLAEILNEYHKLQNFKVTKPSLPEAGISW